MDKLSPPKWATQEPFADTGEKLKLRSGEERPVLKFKSRFFVGETLSLVNPNGYGGRVWSAPSIARLLEVSWAQ